MNFYKSMEDQQEQEEKEEIEIRLTKSADLVAVLKDLAKQSSTSTENLCANVVDYNLEDIRKEDKYATEKILDEMENTIDALQKEQNKLESDILNRMALIAKIEDFRFENVAELQSLLEFIIPSVKSLKKDVKIVKKTLKKKMPTLPEKTQRQPDTGAKSIQGFDQKIQQKLQQQLQQEKQQQDQKYQPFYVPTHNYGSYGSIGDVAGSLGCVTNDGGGSWFYGPPLYQLTYSPYPYDKDSKNWLQFAGNPIDQNSHVQHAEEPKTGIKPTSDQHNYDEFNESPWDQYQRDLGLNQNFNSTMTYNLSQYSSVHISNHGIQSPLDQNTRNQNSGDARYPNSSNVNQFEPWNQNPNSGQPQYENGRSGNSYSENPRDQHSRDRRMHNTSFFHGGNGGDSRVFHGDNGGDSRIRNTSFSSGDNGGDPRVSHGDNGGDSRVFHGDNGGDSRIRNTSFSSGDNGGDPRVFHGDNGGDSRTRNTSFSHDDNGGDPRVFRGDNGGDSRIRNTPYSRNDNGSDGRNSSRRNSRGGYWVVGNNLDCKKRF